MTETVLTIVQICAAIIVLWAVVSTLIFVFYNKIKE